KNEMIKPTVKIDMPIENDVKLFLEEILKHKNHFVSHGSDTDWYKWCKNINSKYPVVLDKHYDSNNPISVYAFVDTLSKLLVEKDTIVLANGAACVVGLQATKIKQNQRIFTNAGASSMGYGIAASLGASYAFDNQERIICIEGDGSIQMNLQ
ncbi:MAG: thiamine pyrophosphate-dependent enzyme, partial [Methylococcales bacterium]